MAEEKKKREVKSVILDSELPEWEEWANRVFGHNNPEKQEYRRNDWDSRKNDNKKKR